MFGYSKSIYMGLIIGLIYQGALIKTNLEEWILRDDLPNDNLKFGSRTGFLDQNREGIFSLFGYVFLYSLSLIYAKFLSFWLFR